MPMRPHVPFSPARNRRSALAALLAAGCLALAACGSAAEEEDNLPPAATAASEAAETEANSAAEVSPSEAAGGVPEACTVTAPETALGEAITSVDVPESTAITAVQELRPDSDVDQSLKWVRVDLCSAALSEEEQRTVATDIAIAARDAEGGGDQIWRVSVGLFVANDAGELEQDRTLFVEEFSSYTWERDAARAPESNWEETGV